MIRSRVDTRFTKCQQVHHAIRKSAGRLLKYQNIRECMTRPVADTFFR